MINHEDSSDPTRKGNWRLRSVVWILLFASIARTIAASWGLTFWPSVALFAVYLVGIAIPVGVTLGVFIRWPLPLGADARSSLSRLRR